MGHLLNPKCHVNELTDINVVATVTVKPEAEGFNAINLRRAVKQRLDICDKSVRCCSAPRLTMAFTLFLFFLHLPTEPQMPEVTCLELSATCNQYVHCLRQAADEEIAANLKALIQLTICSQRQRERLQCESHALSSHHLHTVLSLYQAGGDEV